MLRSNLIVNLNRAVKCPSGAAKGTGAPVIVSHLVDMERTHPVQEIPSYFRSGGARVSASTLFLIIRTVALTLNKRGVAEIHVRRRLFGETSVGVQYGEGFDRNEQKYKSPRQSDNFYIKTVARDRK